MQWTSIAEREREFHNRAFADGSRDRVSGFYVVDGSSNAYYERFLEEHGAGRRVLEYGCGPGSFAFFLAERGAEVTGIDISEVAIEQAAARARKERLRGCDFRVMNAEALAFPDGAFDLICGTGILHHLDLDRAGAEIARTLKPSGAAIFVEPLGHNPIINLYRRLTPRLRTDDEHPLKVGDLRALERRFGRVEARFFHLSSLLAVPLHRRPGFALALAGLEALDRALFRLVPPLQRFAWMVVLALGDPRPAAGG
jgi:SAM-dependent methyltransferase